MLKRKRIGEVLIETGVIDQQKLEQAVVFQKDKNKRLGKILVELGFCTEKQIAEALSKALSVRLVNCNEFRIDDKIKSLVPQAVAEKKVVMPLAIQDNTLLLAMADPLDWETMDSLAFSTGLKIIPAVTFETNLLEAIEKHYGANENIVEMIERIPGAQQIEFLKITEEDEKDVNLETLYKRSETPTIIKLVTTLIVDAIKARASDIHIEPTENNVRVRYRIDGALKDILNIPKNLQSPVTLRVKIISNLDITNRRLPQDGNSQLRFGKKEVDLRISTLPSIYGEKIVMRLLDKSCSLVPLPKLGIAETIYSSLVTTFSQPQGMFVVTGPTGSGKTTTLYACLNQLKSETENIITIEDPVEIRLTGITQVAVNEAVGLTFATALRSILRQDPDIILVGEIRDLETADTAVKAALTGHLVFGTLHTNDTVATITRLIDIGVPNFLISSALGGVLAQRLVRKICEKCKVEAKPPLNLNNLPPLERCYYGEGCPQCFYTGYFGQVGVYEFLKVDIKLKRLIAKNASEEELWDSARASGIISLFDDAWTKVKEGITTVEEVLSKIPISCREKETGETNMLPIDVQ
ncbi:MAG: ATPase, T2SS/T4P/T4SS family [Candidatus Brocadiaceae bacterium]